MWTLFGFAVAAAILFTIDADRGEFSVMEHGYRYFPIAALLSIFGLAAFGVGCYGDLRLHYRGSGAGKHVGRSKRKLSLRSDQALSRATLLR